LRSNLAQARQCFDRAKKKFENALVIAHDVGLNANGIHAVSSARREYNQCLADYSEALGQFWKLMMRGKGPRPAAQRRSRGTGLATGCPKN
jgi:hypothetical protein